LTSTTLKKEVVDFLWDWTDGRAYWARLLVKQITETEEMLSEENRKSIFSYFLQALGLLKDLPEEVIKKPIYSPPVHQMQLITLSEVSGVNRLADQQTITFSPNLTVVYGENGTGKTGYSRILKSLGFSYDPTSKILSDIFSKTVPQSARIAYSVNGTQKEFSWNNVQKNEDLSHLSVFNSNCVGVSLADRQLIVTPTGFRLFTLVTSELNELSALLTAEIAKYPIDVAWKTTLHESTLQWTFVDKLSSKSSLSTLEEISKFDETDTARLAETESDLAKLNKAVLDIEIADLTLKIAEVQTIAQKVDAASALLTPAIWDQVKDLNALIAKLTESTKSGIGEIAERNGVQFYASAEFQTFLKSAEEYIRLLENPNYPEPSDRCVYCQQPLDQTAQTLLFDYRRLLNDTTEADLAAARSTRVEVLKTLEKVETDLKFNLPIAGLDADGKPIQPVQVSNLRLQLIRALGLIAKEGVAMEQTLAVDFTVPQEYLVGLGKLLSVKLDTTKKSLENIAKREKELREIVNELLDRKLLATNKESLVTVIANFKSKDTLNGSTSEFNTSAISRKTTEARNKLVKADFERIFLEEVKHLRKSNLPIQINFGTDRGSSKVSHRISAHQLADILSEGEQKAISPAEFLTELQLDNHTATVVFDDPVTSLDHHIVDDVARRILSLCRNRQVVVFSHSVLLFNSLLYFKGLPTNSDIQTVFYSTSSSFGRTGFITEGEEEINSVKPYISKINVLLSNSPKDRKEADIASEGYGHLRSAIELCVEREIFQGTVKRYQKNIALTSFLRVDGAKVDGSKEKLNQIFERCCGYIIGHSNPELVQATPTTHELRSDFDEFKAIRDLFI
jgi:hypothetical protein